MLLWEFAGRTEQPTAMVVDSRMLQSTPESGARAGYDGAKRRKGSKVHSAVDTLGHLLALHVTPANEQDREEVENLTWKQMQCFSACRQAAMASFPIASCEPCNVASVSGGYRL